MKWRGKVAIAAVALAAASPAHAGVIFSGAGFEDGPAGASVQSGQAGATVQSTLAGHTGRAMTDYGVNRIFSSGPYDPAGVAGQNAVGSVWAETFTAQGSGMVRVSMDFAIDGSASFLTPLGGAAPEFNYNVQVLKGTWNLDVGDDFGDLSATTPGSTQAFNATYTGAFQMPLDFGQNAIVEFEGANAQGTELYRTTQRIDAGTFVITNYGTDVIEAQRFTSDRLIITRNGMPAGVVPYSVSPAAAAGYANLLSTFPVLARGALCNDGDPDQFNCGSGIYEPWTMTLAFDVAAGSQFTVFSALMAEQVSGTLDFFNTARLSGLTVTGGTLASNNAQFQSLGNGNYGFQPAVAGVPEPGTWAMLILGFGLVGGALRRRGERAVLA